MAVEAGAREPGGRLIDPLEKPPQVGPLVHVPGILERTGGEVIGRFHISRADRGDGLRRSSRGGAHIERERQAEAHRPREHTSGRLEHEELPRLARVEVAGDGIECAWQQRDAITYLTGTSSKNELVARIAPAYLIAGAEYQPHWAFEKPKAAPAG